MKMKILSLELFGYRRFSLSNISRFKITASSSVQIILGTNGSGKSSLLEALSPYPQPKSDYVKGGSKKLELEHNNSHFLLVSNYNGSGKHQFIKDGINLNEGGTSSVQKELVEKELGFNSHLHDLLTGKLTFTNMSPTQRREWIMRISNIDLKYALNSYEKIKVRLRDAQGALKHDEIRLGRESQKLIDEIDLKTIREDNEKLQKQISFYLTEKKTNLSNLTDIENEYKDLSNKIESLSSKMLKSKFSYKDVTKITRYEQIIEIENNLMAEDKALKAVLLEQENQLKEDKETLKQLRDDGALNKEGVENKLSTLYEAKSKVAPVPNGYEVTGDINRTLKDTSSVRMNLFELVSEATGSNISVPDKHKWEGIGDSLTDVKRDIQSLENRLLDLNRKRENMENAHKNKCPKCKYVWKPGVSEKELESVKEKILSYSKTQSGLIAKKEKLSQLCENIDTRKTEINRFRGLAHSYPRLRSFWNKIAEKKYLHNNPKDIIGEFQLWQESVTQANNIETINEEIASSEAILERLKSLKENVDIDYFVKKERSLSDKVEKTLLAIERNKDKLEDIKRYKKDFESIAENVNTLVNYVKRLKDLEYEILDTKIQREINTRLETAQLNLANNKRKQTEAETLNGIVNDLKESIGELKNDIIALMAMEKALSPSDGIIAESMTDFINVFVSQLNDLLAKVWEYDMKILPCSKSEGELDYRFPLEVLGQEEPVFDIAKGSTGQREIINFVFTLAVMVYMDLKDFPLFLDEMGASFDETHKSKLVLFIRWLIDSYQCTQVWMISHFAADHGGLINAETCVMDSSNVALPEKFNEHVMMN